jgi:hypothetical protein
MLYRFAYQNLLHTLLLPVAAVVVAHPTGVPVVAVLAVIATLMRQKHLVLTPQQSQLFLPRVVPLS